jgi:hypothetical protein
MKKLTLALAFGTGLAVQAMFAPSAHAALTIQTLKSPTLTADAFNTLFTPVSGGTVQNSPINFVGATNAGTISSEVFQGNAGTAAAGLYAYAYKLSVQNTTNSISGEPVHIDGTSFQFNSTPTGTDFTNSGSKSYAYVVTNGTVGGLTNNVAGDGSTPLIPTSISWQAGQKIGAIRAEFVNSASGAQPLNANQNSATFAVISSTPFTGTFQNAGVLSSDQQTGTNTIVYAPSGGPISPVPVPEPTTILAWAGMAGAVMFVRNVRKNRAA